METYRTSGNCALMPGSTDCENRIQNGHTKSVNSTITVFPAPKVVATCRGSIVSVTASTRAERVVSVTASTRAARVGENIGCTTSTQITANPARMRTV